MTAPRLSLLVLLILVCWTAGNICGWLINGYHFQHPKTNALDLMYVAPCDETTTPKSLSQELGTIERINNVR